MKNWRDAHPDEQIPDGHVFIQPWPAAGADKTNGRRNKVVYYQYRAERARRTLRGCDERVTKAEQAVAGKVPVKRNRFVKLSGGERAVNRELEAKARAIAGLKALHHQRRQPDARLRHRRIPPALADRAVVPDGQARPTRTTSYHRKRDSIEAHLTIVFAALAVTRLIEDRTG